MGKTTHQGLILGITMAIVTGTLFILAFMLLYYYRLRRQRKHLILHPLPDSENSDNSREANNMSVLVHVSA
ncbi:hypothetical protein Mapa_006133 [Marchantia paleacea]|nr:hypothetical protein Mapa_006133 [Marchantia paleacea]